MIEKNWYVSQLKNQVTADNPKHELDNKKKVRIVTHGMKLKKISLKLLMKWLGKNV